MKRIKIVHLLEDLKRGGMENIVVCLARGMDQEQYDIAVWGIVSGGEVADELISAGIKVNILKISNYYNPLNIFKLVVLLRAEKFDILHAHGYFAATVGRLAGIFAGVPALISHVHTIFYNLNKRNVIIDKFLNIFTCKVIFISCAVQESFVKAGYTFGDKAGIIYNGVAPGPLTQPMFDDDKKVLINVASLYAHKGHAYLLNAMKAVVLEFPQAVLWMVGDGPLKQSLEKQVQELGLQESVVFWGRRQDVRRLLSQARIFILSSLREGVPLSIIEAMACGLPVVASRVGGVEEMIVDQKNGILCPPADSGALAAGIISLLRQPQICQGMGQQGRKIFEEHFTRDEMIKRMDVLYKECVPTKAHL